MFSGGQQAQKLKEEFRQHFRNISRIMDCVGCDKCKLWGKLQVREHCISPCILESYITVSESGKISLGCTEMLARLLQLLSCVGL
jgi:hypothetical protein